MALQKDDANSVVCEENGSRSVADGGSDPRAHDGGEKETVGLLGSSAQRGGFGKEMSALHGGWGKCERTTEAEING